MYRYALVLALSSTASAAPCAVIENHGVVLTADNATIAEGGGIVVGILPKAYNDPGHGDFDNWKLDKAKIGKLKHLGPGLEVIPGVGTLRDGDGKTIVTVTKGKVAELDAPTVKDIDRKESRAKHPWTQTTADLTAVPPAGAVALVVLDKAGTIRSWGQVAGTPLAITVFSAGGCAQLPAGTVDSAAGDEVRLAWLDGSGRLSKPSVSVKVTGSTP